MNPNVPHHLAGGKPADAGDFILQRRYRLVRPFLGEAGGHLVDFGCGNGAQTASFADDFDSITGLDVEPGFITEFERNLAGGRAEVRGVPYSGLEAPLPDACADAVVSFEVLEHVEDEGRSLSELYRLLRPGGTLAMSVPNRWWIFETHGAELPLLPWNRVPLFSWLPKPLHDRWARARIYRRREIVGKLRARGFEIVSSAYITAPMDVVKIAPVRDFLRATLFAPDTTPVPFLATAVLVIARRPAQSPAPDIAV